MKNSWYQHWCGASIINERWLISAAHCFDKAEFTQFRVKYGTLHWEQKEAEYQDITLSNVKSYPTYSTSDIDLALIQLPKPIAYTNDASDVNGRRTPVGPACLVMCTFIANDVDCVDCVILQPKESDVLTGFATVAGWGKTELGPANSLMHVDVRILNISCEH